MAPARLSRLGESPRGRSDSITGSEMRNFWPSDGLYTWYALIGKILRVDVECRHISHTRGLKANETSRNHEIILRVIFK